MKTLKIFSFVVSFFLLLLNSSLCSVRAKVGASARRWGEIPTTLKELYENDVVFKEEFEACKNHDLLDRSQWLDYFLQEGLLFKKNQPCIPYFSMRDNLIRE